MPQNKIKVLYLINYAGKAGTEKYVENLITYLHPDKCECSLCFNIDGPLADKIRKKGIQCFQLKMKSPFDMKAAKQLAMICKTNNIDVIHAQYPRENYIAILSKKYYDKPKVIFTSHLTIYQNFIWKITNKIFTKKDDCVISVCKQGKDILISNGVPEDKIKIIYNGINPDDTPPRNRNIISQYVPDDAIVTTILSRLSPEKGLLFLISAFKKATEKTNAPLYLLIGGDGDQKDELQNKINDLNLQDRVKLIGFRTDGPDILAASDIYVNSSSSNEAMSFAILEALGASLPLIVTDVGGNKDLVHEGGTCGIVTDYGDIEAFSEALKKLAEDSDLRNEYKKAAKHKSENEFKLNNLLDEVYKTYLN